ncbi:molybdopterin-guanine dinucleotide biosynthesis protein B [Peribacillus sp. SCS-155]|uniref:molybdopterin-guanine dinucleotide biosynthesis protein B n=1 Tax=Peribacillus sedimenti TaxID=3115297 RepID=UPI003906465F
MAMVKPVIFQIAGYQNRGKTTLISRLITELQQVNLTVSVLKHHGHGGPPDLPEKDSARHFRAGAVASLVEGSGQIQLHGDLSGESSGHLQHLLQLLGLFETDVILIEGYKKEKFPKVVIVKYESDLELLNNLSNIRAIVCWTETLKTVESLRLELPVFSLDSQDFFDWIIAEIRNS